MDDVAEQGNHIKFFDWATSGIDEKNKGTASLIPTLFVIILLFLVLGAQARWVHVNAKSKS
ncbi:hypothetical protein OAP13_02320 [Gammaproteobacteria bacterium]|nr:hypothetical protein [Gammaproteobacteria bacterium]